MREGKQIAKHNKIGVKKPVKKGLHFHIFDRYELVNTSVLEYGYQTIDGFNSEILVLKKIGYSWRLMNEKKKYFPMASNQ